MTDEESWRLGFFALVNNPWMVGIGTGIIATVIGGIILRAILRSRSQTARQGRDGKKTAAIEARVTALENKEPESDLYRLARQFFPKERKK